MNINIRKILLFIGLTFLVNILMVIMFLIFEGKWNTPSSFVLAIVYMFVPMIVAVFIQKYIYKEPIKNLGISFKINKWFLIAWILPVILAFITLGISLLLPGIEYSSNMEGMFERFKLMYTSEQIEQIKNKIDMLPVHFVWISLLQGLIAGISINAVAAFGEELGWRGFLQKELKSIGFWKSSIIIGLIWGVWHAPIILLGHNYPQHPIIGVFMMLSWCVLVSPLFCYITHKANSVIAAAIFHGTINGTYGLVIMLIKGGNDLTVGIMGVPGLLVLLFINIGLFVYEKYFGINLGGCDQKNSIKG